LQWGYFSAWSFSWKSAGVSASAGWHKTPRERKPVYVILDIEYPRLGFIRVDAFDRALAELRESMK
jgi:hypothetical protein